jgi:alkyl sulfatase BDS1-like metallo-beta-lactamase superfamily hydrolase
MSRLPLLFERGALISITGKTDPNAVVTVTTTRRVFENVILRWRTLADAMGHREIITTEDARPVSALWALLVDFELGFPIVEPAGIMATRKD